MSHDSEFDKFVRESKPSWFADGKKRQLMELAKYGAPRPSHDPEFDKFVRDGMRRLGN